VKAHTKGGAGLTISEQVGIYTPLTWGHYERPKLRTQTYPRAHTDTHVTTSEGATEKTSMQKKNGDGHSIRWGRRRPDTSTNRQNKIQNRNVIRNPEHGEGTHKRRGRIDHL
jgi:hypothetical protein